MRFNHLVGASPLLLDVGYHNHRKLTQKITWITALSNSVKLWAMPWRCHAEEYWQNVIHWRREWQNTSVFLPWEPHEQYKKVKRYDIERWNSPGWQVTNMLLEKSREIAPERIKRLSQTKTMQVVDVTGDGSKVRCCKEQNCIETLNVRPRS